jgi:hypothetical protein
MMKKFLSLLLCASFVVPVSVSAVNWDEFEAELIAAASPDGQTKKFQIEKLDPILDSVRNGEIIVDPIECAIVKKFGYLLHLPDKDLIYVRAVVTSILINCYVRQNPELLDLFKNFGRTFESAKASMVEILRVCRNLDVQFVQRAEILLRNWGFHIIGSSTTLVDLFHLTLEDVEAGEETVQKKCAETTYPDDSRDKTVVISILSYAEPVLERNSALEVENAIVISPSVLLLCENEGYSGLFWTLGHEMGHKIESFTPHRDLMLITCNCAQGGMNTYMPAIEKVFEGDTVNFSAIDILQSICGVQDKQAFCRKLLQSGKDSEPLEFKLQSFGQQNMLAFNNRYIQIEKCFAGLPYRRGEPRIFGALSGCETSADVWGVWLCLTCACTLDNVIDAIGKRVFVVPDRGKDGIVVYDGVEVAYPYGIYRLRAAADLSEMLQPIMGIDPGFLARASS